MSKLLFNAQREAWTGAVALHVAFKLDGGFSVANKVIFEPAPPNQLTDPLLKLTAEEAQSLADALYSAGIHPSAAAGSAGQLDAVKYHLEDMRTLVFQLTTGPST